MLKEFKLTRLILSCLLGSSILIFNGCESKKDADTLIYNCSIYLNDSVNSNPDCLVLDQGLIKEIGSYEHLKARFNYKNSIDCKGNFLYPGFIDAHSHFFGTALESMNCNLVGTKSLVEIKTKLFEFKKSKNYPKGHFILGRGWDQNDWQIKEYPSKDLLDSIFPDNPVILKRIDGHAAWVNSKALEMGKINNKTKINGGQILLVAGTPSGILIDNAMELVQKSVPMPDEKLIEPYLVNLQNRCFKFGLTSVSDCGIGVDTLNLLLKMYESKKLTINFYAMINPSKKCFDKILKKGIIQKDNITCRTVKIYADGALGSRGACLLEDYQDQKSRGFLLQKPEYFDSIFKAIKSNGFQVATHAIGDSANRLVIQLYNKYAPKSDNKNYRWRIEHAQIINPLDVEKSKSADLIFSLQPTHATSDMYWAGARLGQKRLESSGYIYQALSKANPIALGTDFPVEDISPIKTFYSAVFRMDSLGNPKGGFQIKNALSRSQTLNGMTKDAAFSFFQEKSRGQIKIGQKADLVLLNVNLLKANPKDVFNVKTIKTFYNGKIVYNSER